MSEYSEGTYCSPVTLCEHSYLLGCLLAELQYNAPLLNKSTEIDGEAVSWLTAADWLQVAASVESITVSTARFDDSLVYCGLAAEYECERSDLLSDFSTRLTIFNYIWGGFEIVAKLLNLPRVPKTIKAGQTSIVDRVIYHLHTQFEPRQTVAFYRGAVSDLDALLRSLPRYSIGMGNCFNLGEHVGLSGVGIHVVRRIRNLFAHGAIAMPRPLRRRKERKEDLEVELIELSARVVLYTVQMLLLAYQPLSGISVVFRENEYGFRFIEDAHMALKTLHIRKQLYDERQLMLFEVDRLFE